MQLSYQKLGVDHPMYGKVEYLVADGMTPLCYKTKAGYVPLQPSSAPTTEASTSAAPQDGAAMETLYLLSFVMNGELEEQTFRSKKQLEQTIELYQSKPFISHIQSKTLQVRQN
ncbi:MAG: hypothetical protein JXR44_03390 [Thiotrichales bacterium]|nr:hypothetical protein [Thiotrichales bacterium]